MNIRIRLKNGREVQARTEEWVAAIIALMPPEVQAAVCDRVEKKIIGYSTPGSFILHAEPGTLGVPFGVKR